MPKPDNERYAIIEEQSTSYFVDGQEYQYRWQAEQRVEQHYREDWFQALEEEGVFQVKPYHLELLRHLQFGFGHYDDGSFRTIEVPPAGEFMGRWGREAIMARIMGIAPHDYREAAPYPGEAPFKVAVWDQEQQELFKRAFWEMRICLDILTYHLTIEAGTYRRVEEIQPSQPKRLWQKVQ